MTLGSKMRLAENGVEYIDLCYLAETSRYNENLARSPLE